MTDEQFMERATNILHNLSLERRSYWFRRWHISAEPLRNDAANLLRERGSNIPAPESCRMIGDTP